MLITRGPKTGDLDAEAGKIRTVALLSLVLRGQPLLQKLRDAVLGLFLRVSERTVIGALRLRESVSTNRSSIVALI